MTVLNKTPTKTYHCTVPLHHAAAMGWGCRHDEASCTGKSAAQRRSSSQRARTSASRPSHTQDRARPMTIPPSQHGPLIYRQILGYLLAVLCLHVRPQNIAPSLVPPQRRGGKVADARRRAVDELDGDVDIVQRAGAGPGVHVVLRDGGYLLRRLAVVVVAIRLGSGAVALHLHLIADAVVAIAARLVVVVVVVIGGVGCRVILQAGLTRIEYIRRDVLGGLPSRRVGREVCVDHFVQHSAAATGSHRHRVDHRRSSCRRGTAPRTSPRGLTCSRAARRSLSRASCLPFLSPPLPAARGAARLRTPRPSARPSRRRAGLWRRPLPPWSSEPALAQCRPRGASASPRSRCA